jgi:hypothetical protein
MDVGKPERIIHVEPIEKPVPEQVPTEPEGEPEPAAA